MLLFEALTLHSHRSIYRLSLAITSSAQEIPVTTQDADLFWDLINQEESPKLLRETVLPAVFNSTSLASALAAVNNHLGFPHPQAGRLLALKKFIAPFDKIHLVIELGQCPVLDIYGFSSTTSFSGKVFEGNLPVICASQSGRMLL
ncbi:hypothetical protein HDV05_005917 [Chytridiales sp. JEL 0842]|nr:hypothetical protein HDV05_005917 [Chytridiales sp. JEL 0842]